MTREDAEALLGTAFDALFNRDADRETLDRYISEGYSAWSDGRVIGREQFEAHVFAIRKEIQSMEVAFEDVVTADDRIAAAMTFTLHRGDGRTSQMRVHAFYTIRDGKIQRLSELTHLLSGAEEDRDLASRT